MPLVAIDTRITDRLYKKLLTVIETDADGNTIERERRTTINRAMKTCRRAWEIATRRNPNKMPAVNPFSRMGLKSSSRETPTATFEELQIFRAKAVELGHPSLATAALIGWEWLQREKDIFATFAVGHYRPKERPEFLLDLLNNFQLRFCTFFGHAVLLSLERYGVVIERRFQRRVGDRRRLLWRAAGDGKVGCVHPANARVTVIARP